MAGRRTVKQVVSALVIGGINPTLSRLIPALRASSLASPITWNKPSCSARITFCYGYRIIPVTRPRGLGGW